MSRVVSEPRVQHAGVTMSVETGSGVVVRIRYPSRFAGGLVDDPEVSVSAYTEALAVARDYRRSNRTRFDELFDEHDARVSGTRLRRDES